LTSYFLSNWRHEVFGRGEIKPAGAAMKKFLIVSRLKEESVLTTPSDSESRQ
jgi:hypothetical protein